MPVTLSCQTTILSFLAVSYYCTTIDGFAPSRAASALGSSQIFDQSAHRISHSSSRLNANNKLFSADVYDTISNGKIAVIPDFLDRFQVADLQRDAVDLWSQGHFTTDALASYGTKGHYDPTKERAVLKLKQWKDTSLGNIELRHSFEQRMYDLRADLAYQLNRPRLLQGDSVNKFGKGSTEISYTRFGPEASLKRHVDEHHEECKGKTGWSKSTRRSLSWLVYLNDPDWNADIDGGCLQCFERVAPPAYKVGARHDGDLQIGWLRPSLADPYERPVFLNSQNHDGNCAMYVDDDHIGLRFITDTFPSHPTLFVAGGEMLVQKMIIKDSKLAARFHFLEPPKSLLNDFLEKQQSAKDEYAVDVEPTGGTLVVFDSVSLPHQVLPTKFRERWATSGWMHEDQQPIDAHPLFVQNTDKQKQWT